MMINSDIDRTATGKSTGHDAFAPLPLFQADADANDYHGIPIDTADPRYRDPLVRAEDFGLVCDKEPGTLGPPPVILCRQLVAQRLAQADSFLSSCGARLYIMSAYRPIARQKALWNLYAEQASRVLPHATESERQMWIQAYVSDPSRFDPLDPSTWPTHTTGAAVDVKLCNPTTLEPLEMGGENDDPGPVVHTDYFERLLLKGTIAPDHKPLHHRRLLHYAMTEQGFVNYPLEYWHFDWGNQMYVHRLRCATPLAAPAAAWFGCAETQDQEAQNR